MRNSTFTAIIAGAFSILTAIAAQNALAQSTPRPVRIDVSQLRASVGEPTASWVQNELAQALAGRTGPNGAPITLRIDYLTLSSGVVDCGSSRDRIAGVAIIGASSRPSGRQRAISPGRPTM
jgi:hypothetical protein